MFRIGFLGCGKIGKALLEYIEQLEAVGISFIQDPGFVKAEKDYPVIDEADEALYQQTDLIIECATAEVLKANYKMMIRNCDVMVFSLTAFGDASFEAESNELCSRYHHTVYVPHGAIMGLDGILDGRRNWTSVTIESTKNPRSMGRDDQERQVVFEGSTRQICSVFPKNVNVHAAVALAGIGFERTVSRMVADPAVNTNSHKIILKADEMQCVLDISSIANGGITGAYVPYSACGSLDRILLRKQQGKYFV